MWSFAVGSGSLETALETLKPFKDFTSADSLLSECGCNVASQPSAATTMLSRLAAYCPHWGGL